MCEFDIINTSLVYHQTMETTVNYMSNIRKYLFTSMFLLLQAALKLPKGTADEIKRYGLSPL